ncbi:hypothetical protein NEUTE2DRAFT_126270 [Neurospora tetrasperma FGSC 2509]|nr:hypothetical protein NEUTE2DRAFT_126270 [Neurospora tetrasperma FGSC 2509]
MGLDVHYIGTVLTILALHPSIHPCSLFHCPTLCSDDASLPHWGTDRLAIRQVVAADATESYAYHFQQDSNSNSNSVLTQRPKQTVQLDQAIRDTILIFDMAVLEMLPHLSAKGGKKPRQEEPGQNDWDVEVRLHACCEFPRPFYRTIPSALHIYHIIDDTGRVVSCRNTVPKWLPVRRREVPEYIQIGGPCEKNRIGETQMPVKCAVPIIWPWFTCLAAVKPTTAYQLSRYICVPISFNFTESRANRSLLMAWKFSGNS